MRYGLALTGVYAALVSAWVYGVLNTELTDVSEPHPFWGEDGGLYLLYGLHLALGLLVGRWWVLGLVLLPPLLAIPAGFEPDGYPEVPIALYLAIQAVVLVPLTTLGVVARRLGERLVRA